MPFDMKTEIFWAAVSALAAVIAIAFSGIAIFQTKGAKKLAENANRIADEANRIAVDAARQSNEEAWRMRQIEEGRDAREAKKQLRASIVVELTKRGNVPSVRVVNVGGGPARSVRISLGGQPVASHEAILGGNDSANPWPIALDSIEERSFLLAPDYRGVDLNPAVAEWEDGTGEPGVWRSDIWR